MAKARMYRLWTWKDECEKSQEEAIDTSFQYPHFCIFKSKRECERNSGYRGSQVFSFFVRVVPPAKRKRRAKR